MYSTGDKKFNINKEVDEMSIYYKIQQKFESFSPLFLPNPPLAFFKKKVHKKFKYLYAYSFRNETFYKTGWRSIEDIKYKSDWYVSHEEITYEEFKKQLLVLKLSK